MEKLHVSADGLQKLKDDLAACKKRVPQVAQAIKSARELGDLRENAEYHAAREEQAMLQARIRDLEDKVARAVVVDERDMDASKALIGATVRVLNKKIKKEVVFTLVSPVESDVSTGRISVRSPIGQALLGTSVGDTVVAKVPAGDVPLEVLEITRD